jgi:hypothetical protein
VVLAIAQAACGQSTATPSPSPGATATATAPAAAPAPGAAAAPDCQENRMQDEVLRFRETTNPTLSNHQVGISNIFERDLPDAKGVVGPRLSAVLVIFDPATKQSRRETVATGTTVAIGADRYCIVGVEEGKSGPGWVSLRKLAP